MKNRSLYTILLTTLAILVIPFVAMRFTDEVNWNLFDFVVAGGLLFGTGFLIELAARKIKNRTSKIAVAALILIVFVLVWAELAVGIIS